MRFLSTKTHGVLDYLMGIVLIAAPWILGFAEGGAETWVPVIIGASAIVYSLMTDYEMGMTRNLSMTTHLWLDGLSGAFLAASPWIFGFSDLVFWPHLILGILEVGSALVTHTVPEHSHHHTHEMNRSHH